MPFQNEYTLPRNTTYSLSVAKEGTNECERNRDQEPEGQESQQCGEGYGSTWTLVPQNQVHQEEQCKHNAETIMNYFQLHYLWRKDMAENPNKSINLVVSLQIHCNVNTFKNNENTNQFKIPKTEWKTGCIVSTVSFELAFGEQAWLTLIVNVITTWTAYLQLLRLDKT